MILRDANIFGTLDVTWAAANGDQLYLGVNAGGGLAEIGRHATTPVHPTAAQVIPLAGLDEWRYAAIGIAMEKINAAGVDDATFAFTADGTTLMRAWAGANAAQIAFLNPAAADGSGDPGPFLQHGSTGTYHSVTLGAAQFVAAIAAGQKRALFVNVSQVAAHGSLGSIGQAAYTILLKPLAATAAGKTTTIRFTLFHAQGR